MILLYNRYLYRMRELEDATKCTDKLMDAVPVTGLVSYITSHEKNSGDLFRRCRQNSSHVPFVGHLTFAQILARLCTLENELKTVVELWEYRMNSAAIHEEYPMSINTPLPFFFLLP